jgi:NADH dehydrogenase
MVRALAMMVGASASRCGPNNALFLRPMGRVGQIQLVKANVQDEEAVRAALKGADAAINPSRCCTRAEPALRRSPCRGGRADRARQSELGVKRLLHVSALGIAGSASRYAQTKTLGEARARRIPGSDDLPPSTVFGPEDDFFNKFGWLARLSPAAATDRRRQDEVPAGVRGRCRAATVKVLGDATTAGRSMNSADRDHDAQGGHGAHAQGDAPEPPAAACSVRAARIKAVALGLLPKPLLTLDQVRLLESDAIVSDGALTFHDLGIVPEAPGAIIPSYLWRFRKHGEFEPATS